MQSSSNLFPVRLISAEVHGNFFEDAYLLKPNNSPDKTVEIAVTRYSASEKGSAKRPLVLLHGLFSNRLAWLPFPGTGLAHYFARQGYEVWMPELRGHGFSPMNKGYLANTFRDYIEFDLPAVNDFIIEKTGKRPVWIGDNFGGLALSASLGVSAIPANHIAGAVLLGTQVGHMHWVLNMPLTARIGAWLRKRQDVIEGHLNGYGPENEPSKLVAEAVKWQTWKGWKSKEGLNYFKSLKNVTVPLLSIAPTSRMADKKSYYDKFYDAVGSKSKLLLKIPVNDEKENKLPHSLVTQQHLIEEVGKKVCDWLDESAGTQGTGGALVA